MQPFDTGYWLPLVGLVTTAAAVAPERWFKRLFLAGLVVLPLAITVIAIVDSAVQSGLGQGVLTMIVMTMLLYGFWCLPILLGLTAGFALRSLAQFVKDRVGS